MLLGMGYPTGKKTRSGTGMGKNSNPHAGMSFLRIGVRVGGCGYGTALPDGFLPVAISTDAVCHGARCIFLLNLRRTIYFCKIVIN
jgi:hypothetical protein